MLNCGVHSLLRVLASRRIWCFCVGLLWFSYMIGDDLRCASSPLELFDGP